MFSRLKWRLLPLIRFGFTLTGRSWNDFYAWMLNRQDRGVTIEHILKLSRDVSKGPARVKGLYDVSVGPRYVEFLKTEGLKANHQVLDFGCGYGRMAIPLLRFLKPRHYVGIDLSAERIRIAREFVKHQGLDGRFPGFYIARPDNDMSFLGLKSFDVIWAHSVFSHMPLSDVEKCLIALSKLLKDDGFIIANYGVACRIMKTNISAFWVPIDMMRKAIEHPGLDYAETDDYWLKIAPERTTERMMRLTKAVK